MPVNILKELKIEVTYKCPLSCVHCSSEANNENSLFMTKEKCLSIISQASELGVEKIAISGGEPLVWDGLEEVIDKCNINNIEASIYTSGNCENIEDKFKLLSDVKLKKAIFSIYSPDEKEHVRITRKRDSFQNTLRAISACKKYSITPEIHFVALASNYQKLIGIVDLAKKEGVEIVSVLRFVPQGRGALIEQRDTLSAKQNKELIQTIKAIRETGFYIRTGSPFNVLFLNKNPKCMAARDRMIVAPDLSIYPCDAFKQIEAAQISKPVIASSLKSNSLKKCWEDSSYLNTIRDVVSSPVEGTCKSCVMYENCLSGCLAQKFLKYNTLKPHRDPACLRIGVSK